MPFVLFHDFHPELAERETRSLTLPLPDYGLPAGRYGMLEMYCDEPGCDCRRVLFMVVSPEQAHPLAVVNFGWESLEFYSEWGAFGGVEFVEELKGPSLNIGSPQSKLAPGVLTIVKEVLLQDPAYIERLKRHYHMVRAAVDRKTVRRAAWRLDPRRRKRLRAEKLRERQAKRPRKRNPPS